MFFELGDAKIKITRAFAAVGLVLASSGCSYFLKEKPKPGNAIVIAQAEGKRDCLAKTFDVMGQYFSGSGNIAETDRIVDCATGSIDLFTKNTVGSLKSGYSQMELKSFVERYFLKGQPLDPELMPLLFRLKSSLIGGSTESISRDEVKTLRELMVSFKTYARQLQPFADIYGFSAPAVTRSDAEIKRFDAAAEAFVETVEAIADRFKGENRPDFSISDFEKLIDISGKLPEAKRFTSLAGSIKEILVRPPSDRVAATDWKLLASAGARLYTFYLRHYYYLKGSSILWGPDLGHLETVVRQSMTLLDKSAAHRPGGRILPEEMERLVDRLGESRLLPVDLRKESLKALVWPLSARFFRDPLQAPPARKTPTGMGAAELVRLRADVENWIAGHRIAIGVADDERIFAEAQLREHFKQPLVLITSSPVQETWRSARTEMSELLSRGRLLAWDEEGRLKIVRREEAEGMRRKDLILLNAIRGVVRIVLRGYAGEIERAKEYKGITEDEMQEFYLDVREFGIDLGLMDSRVFTAGARSFLEANLFTSQGNGDDFMSPHEGVEFFEYIFSGGALAQKIQAGAERVPGCLTNQMDFTGKIPRLDAICLRRHIRANFETYFSNLPGMVEYVRGFNDDDAKWSAFIRALEDASRNGGFNDSTYEFSELRTLSPILHYTESLFVNFDRDRTDVLEKDDIWSAFPRFKGFLRKLGNGAAETPEIQESIFSFMIFFGRPPSHGMKGKGETAAWILPRKTDLAKADRLDVLKIISAIAVHSRQTRFAMIDAFLEAQGTGLAQALQAGDKGTVKKMRTLFSCPEMADDRLAQLMRTGAVAFSAEPTFEQRRALYCKSKQKTCAEARRKTKLIGRTFAERVNEAIKAEPELARICLPVL